MNNQKQSLVSKVAILGIYSLLIPFLIACINSMKKTHDLCAMALGNYKSESLFDYFINLF